MQGLRAALNSSLGVRIKPAGGLIPPCPLPCAGLPGSPGIRLIVIHALERLGAVSRRRRGWERPDFILDAAIG
jgi:hypothetical protein